MEKERKDDFPDLSNSQKQEIIVVEIQQWQNGIYVNEILAGAARLLNDKPAIEVLEKDLDQSHKIVDEFKKEYLRVGGEERSFDVPNVVKVRLLEMEVVRRQQPIYTLELRAQAAQDTKNKEMATRATEELARIRGYLRALVKEYKALRRKVEKPSSAPGAYTSRRPRQDPL